MKAVTWQGRMDMRVEEVPDPAIQEPTDAIVRITTTGLCGSDLHLYDPLTPFMTPGDVVGHEPMGIVEEVGPAVTALRPGDRVVVPFNVSCGSCWMCDQHLYSQCETTQNRDHGTGASLFGYSKLYGQVPGGQAELLRVPFYMAQGETDIALKNGQAVMAVINKYGIRNFWVLSTGGHEWANWRRYLHQTAQIMFPEDRKR